MSAAAARPKHPGWPAHLGPLRVKAGVVTARPIRISDAQEWSRHRTSNEAEIRPWEPTLLGNWAFHHKPSRWYERAYRLRVEARTGRMLPLIIEVDGQLAGQLTVGGIVRGAIQSGWIGYWVAGEVTGGGVATAAMALGLDHCFGPMGLHRVEATVRPENIASHRVLQNVGMRAEGVLHRYLDVDHEWRDHALYAITCEEVPGSVVEHLISEGRASR